MRLKYEFKIMKLNDQSVAVPVGDGAYDFHGVIKMNDTAVSILNLLKDETTIESIVEALSQEYDVQQEKLAADVERYIKEFQEKGLLV